MGNDSKSIVLSPRCRDYIKHAADLEESTISPEEKISYWTKIADEFLIAGIPKERISTEVRNAIQKQMVQNYKVQKIEVPEAEIKINSGQYYRWAREKGYTNPFFARNKDESVANGNNEDSSDFTKELSEDEPYYFLRNKLILIFQEMRNQLKENIKLIKDETHNIPQYIWEKFFDNETETKKFFDLFVGMTVASFVESNKCRDARQMILPTDRFNAVSINYFVYNSWYCKKYHAIVKERHNITTKKFSIFLEDQISRSYLIYHNMLDPLNLHFLDIKCPQCGRYSLKTNWIKGGTWNIVCINESAHNDKKLDFPATLIDERLDQLAHNRGGAATTFLRERGIEISDNEAKVISK